MSPAARPRNPGRLARLLTVCKDTLEFPTSADGLSGSPHPAFRAVDGPLFCVLGSRRSLDRGPGLGGRRVKDIWQRVLDQLRPKVRAGHLTALERVQFISDRGGVIKLLAP